MIRSILLKAMKDKKGFNRSNLHPGLFSNPPEAFVKIFGQVN